MQLGSVDGTARHGTARYGMAQHGMISLVGQGNGYGRGEVIINICYAIPYKLFSPTMAGMYIRKEPGEKWGSGELE